jgi:hypothetical protein
MYVYKFPNRTYVRIREHTVLVFVHPRVAYVAELVADVAELVPDLEDGARAEVLVAESRNSGRRGRCARVTGRSQELAAVLKKKRS